MVCGDVTTRSIVRLPGPYKWPWQQERAMPEIARPDGATIHFEVYGSGFPLLLIAPGGVSSEIRSWWERSPVNPIKELADEFMVIGMDQRHAGGSPAPAAAFSYDLAVADQLA